MRAYADLTESEIQRRMLVLEMEGSRIDRRMLALELEILGSLASELAESGRGFLGQCSLDDLRRKVALSERGAAAATEGADLRVELALRELPPSD